MDLSWPTCVNRCHMLLLLLKRLSTLSLTNAAVYYRPRETLLPSWNRSSSRTVWWTDAWRLPPNWSTSWTSPDSGPWVLSSLCWMTGCALCSTITAPTPTSPCHRYAGYSYSQCNQLLLLTHNSLEFSLWLFHLHYVYELFVYSLVELASWEGVVFFQGKTTRYIFHRAVWFFI